MGSENIDYFQLGIVAVQLMLPILLLFAAWLIGTLVERSHYKSIRLREERLRHIITSDLKHVPNEERVGSAHMVTGSVVLSVDHFKRFLAALRKIFGGEIGSYSSLLDRARREALLRLKESDPQAHMFVNLRIETTSISKGARKTVGSVEVMTYATAIRFRE